MKQAVKSLVNRRAIITTTLLALTAYAVFAIWAEVGNVQSVWKTLRWELVPLVLLLSLVNYGLRFTNWQFYLSSLGIRSIPRYDSLRIFIGGFGLGITPGKVGEVVRSVLLKERHGIPFSRTAGILIIDRLTDVLALLLIASVGVLQLKYGAPLLIALAVIALGGVGCLAYRPLCLWLMNHLDRVPVLGSKKEMILEFYDSMHSLVQPKRIFIIIAISLLSWSCEAIGFYVIFQMVGISASLPLAFFIYAFSTLLGAVAFLPGGLGLTEGSMTGLLVLVGVPTGPAAVATVLIRLATLWFGLLLGIVCLSSVSGKRT